MQGTYEIYCETCKETTVELVGHTHYHLQSDSLRADWLVVCDTLSYKGSMRRLFTDKEREQIQTLADGFGKIDASTPGYAEMIWDWSHVRDSSDAAVQAMAAEIRSRLHMVTIR